MYYKTVGRDRPLLERNGWKWTILFVTCLIGIRSASADLPHRGPDSAGEYTFVPLLDGSGLEGWSHQGNWKVEEAVITRTGDGGHLVCRTMKVPDDFELRFEWKVALGSNSGVFYRPGRCEYQILDNANHVNGKNPRTSAASLYFCMQPSHDATNPVGQWNAGGVLCKGTRVQHWLNGEKVVDFDYSEPKYRFNLGMMKARGGDITSRGGHVTLQDHGGPVWYRNMELRPIADSEELDRTPVRPAAISQELLLAERIKIKQTIAYRKKREAEKRAESETPDGPTSH